MRRRWGVDAGDFVVLHAGAFCPLKGQHLAVELLSRLPRAEERPVRLVLVGDELYSTSDPSIEGYRESVARRARELGVFDRVVFAGRLSDMASAYAASDVLVCTTLPGESFGRVVVEAMAAGLPVLSFDTGGPSEIVAHGESGFLVPPGDTGEMAERLLELIRSPALRHRMSSAAVQAAFRTYDRSRLGPALVEAYDGLFRRNSP